MMDKGYFRVVERMTEAEDDYQFVTVTTMITGAGQYHLLAHFLDKYGVRRQLSLFGGDGMDAGASPCPHSHFSSWGTKAGFRMGPGLSLC